MLSLPIRTNHSNHRHTDEGLIGREKRDLGVVMDSSLKIWTWHAEAVRKANFWKGIESKWQCQEEKKNKDE